LLAWQAELECMQTKVIWAMSLALACTIATTVYADPSPQSAREIVVEAERLLDEGDAKKALALLDLAKNKLGKTNPRLQVDIVRAAAGAGDSARVLREHDAYRAFALNDAVIDEELGALRKGAERTLEEERKVAEKAMAERERVARAAIEERNRVFESAFAKVAIAKKDGASLSSVQAAIVVARTISSDYPSDPRSLELEQALPELETTREKLELRDSERRAAKEQANRADNAIRARKSYAIGTAWLVGGLALGAGGTYLLVEKPIDIFSYPLGGAALGVGVAMVVFAKSDFEKGAYYSNSARTNLRLIAAPMPGGAFVGTVGTF